MSRIVATRRTSVSSAGGTSSGRTGMRIRDQMSAAYSSKKRSARSFSSSRESWKKSKDSKKKRKSRRGESKRGWNRSGRRSRQLRRGCKESKRRSCGCTDSISLSAIESHLVREPTQVSAKIQQVLQWQLKVLLGCGPTLASVKIQSIRPQQPRVEFLRKAIAQSFRTIEKIQEPPRGFQKHKPEFRGKILAECR